MEAERPGPEKAGGAFAVDTGRLGQSFILLGAILLTVHVALTATSLVVPAESSWMIFNIWSIPRFVSVAAVCCVLIAIGWLLCKRKGCALLGNEAEPVPGKKDALPDVRKPQ
jgi:hypothetical protein